MRKQKKEAQGNDLSQVKSSFVLMCLSTASNTIEHQYPDRLKYILATSNGSRGHRSCDILSASNHFHVRSDLYRIDLVHVVVVMPIFRTNIYTYVGEL